MGKAMKTWGCIWRSLAGAFLVPCAIAVIVSLFRQCREFKVKEKARAVKTEKKSWTQDFTYAVPGDVWIIDEDNIPLVDVPKSFSDQDQFKAHLNCIINTGSKVEIIKHTIAGNWKYVRVLSGSVCSGWVSGYIVKKSHKASKW